jgi:dTDP-4-dehydrorhamnose reductase
MPLIQKFASELKSNQECRPFANLFMAPVSLRFVVDALVKVAESGQGGIFHLSGEKMVSYADFVRSYAMHFGYPTDKVVEAALNNDAIPSPLESKAYAFLGMDRTTELLNIFPRSLASVLADL